mgnify:CR=1 FL=1
MRKGTKVFAWRDIGRGEEITNDYRLNAFTREHWECLYGSAMCKGYVVSSFFSLDEDVQRAYLPYAPAFIRREHRARRAASRS